MCSHVGQRVYVLIISLQCDDKTQCVGVTCKPERAYMKEEVTKGTMGLSEVDFILYLILIYVHSSPAYLVNFHL